MHYIVWATGGVNLVMTTFVLQDGCSPLMAACEEGHVEVVKSLIEAGANINHTNKVGTHAQFYFTLFDAHPPLPYCYRSLSMYIIIIMLLG